MRLRLTILITVFFLAFSALLFKLYDLQIVNGKTFAAKAASQYYLAGILEPKRGILYFRNKGGDLAQAALNREYPVVYAVPKEIEDVKEAASNLALFLKLDQSSIEQKLSKANDSYELLAEKVGDSEIEKIKEAKIKGVYIDARGFRFYPFGNLAAHVLGFVGSAKGDSELKGRYGLEALFDGDLRGVRGVVEGKVFKEPVHGRNIELTIDRGIQTSAEQILLKTIDSSRASSGTVIVQETSTGKILALANFPSFDPNAYSKSKVGDYLNTAVQAIYEPGSVFKVITMAAGIDSGKVSPETVYNDTGSVTLNGKTIKNYDNKVYGRVTMTSVIEHSINTGAAYAEKLTGHKSFLDYVVKFGFDEKTGVSLPGEIKGSLRTLRNDVRDINFATASFGQGISVTPMQLINAISAIGNGGLLMKPTITADQEPLVVRRVIRAETASKVTAMMVSAVKKAGIAQITNYTVAGKTGTAQIPDFKKGGYTNQFIHTFTGFAPGNHPAFTILIKIDKPQIGSVAAATVVPAFRELAEFILNYYNIPPDDLMVQDQK